jgi:hypothetical protein
VQSPLRGQCLRRTSLFERSSIRTCESVHLTSRMNVIEVVQFVAGAGALFDNEMSSDAFRTEKGRHVDRVSQMISIYPRGRIEEQRWSFRSLFIFLNELSEDWAAARFEYPQEALRNASTQQAIHRSCLWRASPGGQSAIGLLCAFGALQTSSNHTPSKFTLKS